MFWIRVCFVIIINVLRIPIDQQIGFKRDSKFEIWAYYLELYVSWLEFKTDFWNEEEQITPKMKGNQSPDHFTIYIYNIYHTPILVLFFSNIIKKER